MKDVIAKIKKFFKNVFLCILIAISWAIIALGIFQQFAGIFGFGY